MRGGSTKGGGWGEPSCPKSSSCSRPHPRPQTPLPVLCLFQMAQRRPCGMGLGSWSTPLPRAQWKQQSWDGLGLGWGEGTCKSSFLALGTLPAHAWWGLLGDSQGDPEPGVQLPAPHPPLSPRLAFSSHAQHLNFSVLTWQLWGP